MMSKIRHFFIFIETTFYALFSKLVKKLVIDKIKENLTFSLTLYGSKLFKSTKGFKQFDLKLGILRTRKNLHKLFIITEPSY